MILIIVTTRMTISISSEALKFIEETGKSELFIFKKEY